MLLGVDDMFVDTEAESKSYHRDCAVVVGRGLTAATLQESLNRQENRIASVESGCGFEMIVEKKCC